MFFVMAIRTNKFKVLQGVVIMISVLVMHMQDFYLGVATSLTGLASCF